MYIIKYVFYQTDSKSAMFTVAGGLAFFMLLPSISQ